MGEKDTLTLTTIMSFRVIRRIIIDSIVITERFRTVLNLSFVCRDLSLSALIELCHMSTFNASNSYLYMANLHSYNNQYTLRRSNIMKDNITHITGVWSLYLIELFPCIFPNVVDLSLDDGCFIQEPKCLLYSMI